MTRQPGNKPTLCPRDIKYNYYPAKQVIPQLERGHSGHWFLQGVLDKTPTHWGFDLWILILYVAKNVLKDTAILVSKRPSKKPTNLLK